MHGDISSFQQYHFVVCCIGIVISGWCFSLILLPENNYVKTVNSLFLVDRGKVLFIYPLGCLPIVADREEFILLPVEGLV